MFQKIWAISTISDFDLLTIPPSFYYMVDEKFRCDEKVLEYAKRSSLENAKMLIQKANGCNVIDEKVKYEIDNIGYHSCFCTYRHPYFNDFLFLYKNYEKGLLPFQGSLMNQPAYIIEIFNMIDNLKADFQETERRRQEKGSNR